MPPHLAMGVPSFTFMDLKSIQRIRNTSRTS
jgi:hypothetical protein